MRKYLLLLVVLIGTWVNLTACRSSMKTSKITIDTENGSILHFKGAHRTLTKQTDIDHFQKKLKKIRLQPTNESNTDIVGATQYTVNLYTGKKRKETYIFYGDTLQHKKRTYHLSTSEQATLQCLLEKYSN